MATVVLQTIGTVVGGALGGPVGAAIGGALGSAAGYALDQKLFATSVEDRVVEGPRLSGSQFLSSEEGSSIPRVYGIAKVSGELIWGTNFEEVRHTTTQGGGGGGKGGRGGGGGQKVTQVTYKYFGNFAIALCEGQISSIRNVWADGTLIDLSKISMRIYRGLDDQDPDSLIAAKQGIDNTPAYRGLAYVVFEHFPLSDYGNRIPQFSFEVIKSIGSIEKNIKAITLMPGATEFGYDPLLVVDRANAVSSSKLNQHILSADTDWQSSLDELQSLCPNLESVAIIVPWFGDDLRCGSCQLRPGVEVLKRTIVKGEDWAVSGIPRGNAYEVSKIDNRPAYGGTPNDAALIRAIKDLKMRGLKVSLYPFILMDIAKNNALPSPYDPNETQGAFPWRGRITSSLAPNLANTPDKSDLVLSELDNFIGNAKASDFTHQNQISIADLTNSYNGLASGLGQNSVTNVRQRRPYSKTGETIKYNGAMEWSYRRLILHYAHLCAVAGGVDSFLIGSEMRGLTTLRAANNRFPFVEALKTLALEVKQILGSNVQLTYAADWSEYFGYHPQDGSGDHFFHLDALWADPNISAIGIDNYMPISDWREDGDPTGYKGGRSSTDIDMLRYNIAKGEGYDWFYATESDREDAIRSPITDGLGKPWVFRYKDLWNWWSNLHYNRIGGVEEALPTDWQPYMKSFWFTELGCPAIDKGANQPNVFADPKSSESNLPRFSLGVRDDLMQSNFILAHQEFWDPNSVEFIASNNPLSPLGKRMVDVSKIYLWTWDARPFPIFPKDLNVWSDGINWATGHWLNGRLGAGPLKEILAKIMDDHGFYSYNVSQVEGFVEGYVVAEVGSARAALEAIIELYQLVVYEEDGLLIFKNPSRDEPLSLSLEKMVDDQKNPLRNFTRVEENELPNRVNIDHINPSKQYRRSISSSKRLEGHSERMVQLNVPVVISEAEIIPIINRWLQFSWIARERVSFALSQEYRYLQLGDLFHFDGSDQQWQITQIEDGLFRKIEARAIENHAKIGSHFESENSAIYTDNGAGYVYSEFLDLPILEGDGELGAVKIASSVEPWQGAVTIFSSPDGENFDFRQILQENAIIGEITTPLLPSFHSRWDNGSHVEVLLYRGELSALPDLQVLNGGNTAFIRSATNGWEIIQFKNAELIGENLWRLSGLLRAQAGSDVEMLAGCEQSASFVLANEAVNPLNYQLNETGLTMVWRAVSGDEALSDASAEEQIFTPGLMAQRPYRPVHFKAVRQDNGDVHFSWIRRTRINGDNWHNEEVPLSETEENYLLEIYQSGIKLREFYAITPSWDYIQSEQSADGLAMGASISAYVSQLNSSFGYGPKASINLNL